MPGDLYTEWLEVPPGKRPPHHYALLGLPVFCKDLPDIEQAARKRLARLDRYAIHPDPKKRDACHRLMNEVARARVVLASPARKRAYEVQLAAALGVAPPQDTAVLAEQAPADEADTGAEAESYLQQLARAAREKQTTHPTRRTQRPSWLVPAGSAAAALLLVIGLWLAFKPSSSTSNKIAMEEKPSTTMPSVIPEAPAKPIPATAPGVSPGAVAALPTTPPAAPPHTAPRVQATSAASEQHVPAQPAVSPLVAMNASLDRLADWTVDDGIWSIVESGRLRGEGPSMIDFDPDLPPQSTFSFHLCVVKGMRPRIYFDGPEIYVGNEGYSKKITVFGKVKELSGEALNYKNGQEIAVRISFVGSGRFELQLNDNILTGVCQPHAKIHLRLSGGDWWSKGITDFWDMHIGTGSSTDDHPNIDHPAEKPPEKPIAPPAHKGLFDQ